MSFSKSFAFRSVIGLVIVSVLALSIYYWYRIQYQDFLQYERETIALFDQLNVNVAKTLPPLPPDSSIQMKGSIGIGLVGMEVYLHGRILETEISTKQSPDFILEYYDTMLLSQGWIKDTNNPATDNATYYQGATCIKIDTTSLFRPNYGIFIWHDYKNQDFTPEIPKYVSWFEFGKTTFLKCP